MNKILHLLPITVFIILLVYIVYAFRPENIYSLDPVAGSGVTFTKLNLTSPSYVNHPYINDSVTAQLYSPRYHYLLSPQSVIIQAKRQERKIQAVQEEEKHIQTPDSDWKTSLCPTEKIARWVAQAETQDCTKWVWLSKRNCFGIKKWGHFVTYASKEESYEAFMNLWDRRYGWCPSLAQAKKYTNNDHPERWLKIVYKYIYE